MFPKAKRLSIVLAIAMIVSTAMPVMAADSVFFTLTAPSTYLYDSPNTGAARVYSIFKGEIYGVLARSADSVWLQLNFPGAAQQAWVRASFGTLDGDVASLPVSEGAPVAAPTIAATTAPAAGPVPTVAADVPVTNTGSGTVLPVLNIKYTITTASTYVRSGPGRNYGAILSIFKNAVFNVRGRSQDMAWLQISLPGGPVDSWVSSGVGTLSNSATLISLPVAVPGAAPAAAAVVQAPVVAAGPAPRPLGPGGFELGGQVAGFDFPQLMKSAGMGWVKRQVRWGPGSTADAGLINDAHAKGFKVLLSVLGDPNSLRGGSNYDEFARFVGDLARYGADGIEVWNEMNIDREWPSGEINPAAYTELLRRAYSSIKAANPGTIVISGAPAPTGYFGGCSAIGCDDAPYIQGMVNAGALNYMDCLGIHYNEGVVPPTQAFGDPRGNPNHYTRYYQTMVDTYYNAGGGRKQLCFTELGYLSGQEWGYVPGGYLWKGSYNLTVAEQAQFLAQAAQLSRDQGKVRMMIIFNVDLTHWGNDPQAGYAIVRPGGGCPACDTLRAVVGSR
jgi:uncharacterized protein YgiM (DUF1202 family)